MDSNEIRAKVDTILRDAAIGYETSYVGKTSRPQTDEHGKPGKPWQCDQWQTAFIKPPGERYEFPFYMGLGNRKQKPGSVACNFRRDSLAYEAWAKVNMVPSAPHVADVLHSLVSDASAVDMSFRDWCADYGYSDDSISALNTYNECCKIGEQLRKLFTRETLASLREALQDY